MKFQSAGRFVIYYRDFPGKADSFYHSLYNQLQCVLKGPRSASISHLKAKVRSYLLSREQYDSGIDVNPPRFMIGYLARDIKCAIELYNPDGFRTIWPFQYQTSERKVRLYYDGLGYSSVHKVSLKICMYILVLIKLFQVEDVKTHFMPPQLHLRIGSWNTQGGATLGRQAEIDATCKQFNLEIACVQDIRLQSTFHQTENYRWLTSCPAPGQSRVNAFLIRKDFNCLVQLIVLSSDLQLLYIDIDDHHLILANVYMPCDGTLNSDTGYHFLSETVRDLRLSYPTVQLLLCGDFNGHLGKDLVDESLRLTGPFLHHAEGNGNGDFLWQFLKHHRLVATTTFSDSCLITRATSQTSSQLDHILIPQEDNYLLTDVLGSWGQMSDHKILHCSLRLNRTQGE